LGAKSREDKGRDEMIAPCQTGAIADIYLWFDKAGNKAIKPHQTWALVVRLERLQTVPCWRTSLPSTGVPGQ
jgi:hypothetical protein